MSPVLPVAALVVAGYLSGSLLGAVWVCRALGRRDPRYAGSRNPGFSNVLRVHGAVPAALTLTVDAVKAMPVLWVAQREALPLWLQGAVGLSVLVGHSYPAWHRGRGGKAVASALGVLLMIATPVAWVCALCWAILAWRSRTAAVASLAAALLAPLASYWLAREATLVVSIFSALVLVRHAWNIRRLGQGGEPGLARSSREEDGDVRPPEG